jgi:hypothetical protein
LSTQPTVGVPLYFALKDARELTVTSVGFARLNLLDLALFAAPDTAELRVAWERRLNQARSDADLLEVVVTASLENGSAWLDDVLRRDLQADRPFSRARAVVLCGFREKGFAVEALRGIAALGDDTWLGKLAAESLERQRRNQSAEHQARALMCEPDTDRAWAAFRLLLTVVDRRIACWHERVAADPLARSRLTFVDSNSQVVEKAIFDNEKPLREHFLGQTVREGQVWPWIDAIIAPDA